MSPYEATAGEIILAPHHGEEPYEQQAETVFASAGSAVVEALETAHLAVPEIERSRALRDALAVKLHTVEARRPPWAILPPPVAAALSAAAVLAGGVLAGGIDPHAAGRVQAVALIADLWALATFAMIAFRRGADGGRNRLRRWAWLAGGAAALAGLAAFGMDAFAGDGGPTAPAAVAGLAFAAATPWLLARLASAESSRLAAELASASAALAAAEARGNAALAAAREVFSSELTAIAGAMAGAGVPIGGYGGGRPLRIDPHRRSFATGDAPWGSVDDAGAPRSPGRGGLRIVSGDAPTGLPDHDLGRGRIA